MTRRVTYDSIVPSGAGAVSVDFKPDRVSAPRLGGICFQNMQSVSDLQAAEASAPADHAMRLERIKQRGKIKADHKIGITRKRVEAQVLTFSKGATVKDVKTGSRGIIIKANASYTAKTHSPVHRVCDDNGNVWLQKEKHLKLLY